ncbi:MAG TPA: HAD family hydrolase [Bacteroidia bacterium]|nr:HAD family hydrolase [Bacteroidia bacterium]
MNKAVFLDRDGVINKDLADYTFRIADFEFTAGLFDALKNFQQKNYLLIVITNQAGIARNIYTHNDVEQLHNYMQLQLEEKGIHLAEIYYCPHYTETGKCICRKPDSLLLEKALARFNIDPLQSYFIGDRDRDIEAGEKANVKGIKVDGDADLRTILHLIK